MTSPPSRKCTAWMAPATRDRSSTLSTASNRPETSRQTCTGRGWTVVTVTGTAGGAAATSVEAAWASQEGSKYNAAPVTAKAVAIAKPHRAALLILAVMIVSFGSP